MTHQNRLNATDQFLNRHIGPTEIEVQAMAEVLGFRSLEAFIDAAIPGQIRTQRPLALETGVSEHRALQELRDISKKNLVLRSYLGMGYSDCITPPVIQRNILENPGWYTQYTPYQPELAQGRLEALLNFQTLVMELTGFAISNASVLDEGTAAAEAMSLCFSVAGRPEGAEFFVSDLCHPQTIAVVQTRAEPLHIRVVVGDHTQYSFEKKVCFGVLLQYPATDGTIFNFQLFTRNAHDHGALVVAATDLLSLTLLTPPAEWGADVAIGNSQRLGVPLGFGGPHAGFFATHEQHKRLVPGRIVGVSQDRMGQPAYRLALQTREQHIRRDKATSNICTAQVLLAIMSSMYAIYHGPHGLRAIAERVHLLAVLLKEGLDQLGYQVSSTVFFDTLRVHAPDHLLQAAQAQGMNFRLFDAQTMTIAVDEATSEQDLDAILQFFADAAKKLTIRIRDLTDQQHVVDLPTEFRRKKEFLTQAVFNSYHSETEMLRYISRLQSRDLSLAVSMIPLGSCTMKLNATSEMMPVTWPEFSRMHPCVPEEQTQGYQQMFVQLQAMLAEITGFTAVSLQPNAGSQGEYAGLLAIRNYHLSRGDLHKNVCLIPRSAHGTNPATASMAGMIVVVVDCDRQGNIDLVDLKEKAEHHARHLAAIMVTYPSTHGVFEEGIQDICSIVHHNGGLVYMDGANMNAQIGLCKPAELGADVCHLNLHKTFCIPHGGGGPGMGPIAVNARLAPFLPPLHGKGAVSSAPWGSASILPISWMYIKMMGANGLRRATEVAILNANYLAFRLKSHFPLLYAGKTGLVAHECILDLRHLKESAGIEVEDVAKRLMDYGFHAPTVSFPVAGTLMIEPTESESRAEIDRFCDALISIRAEIAAIESGRMSRTNNLLKNAPHTARDLASQSWDYPYSREQAVYPMDSLKHYKFWPAVSRINNVLGDRHLICGCS